MKLANMIAAGAALTAGLVGGTATYLVAAQPDSPSEAPPARTTEVSATSPDPTLDPALAPSKPIVRLARCKPPAVREGRACVTEVVETVVLPASTSVSSVSTGSGGASAPSQPHEGDDDSPGGHDDSEDESSGADGHGGGHQGAGDGDDDGDDDAGEDNEDNGDDNEDAEDSDD